MLQVVFVELNGRRILTMTYKNFETMPFVLDVSDIADTLKIGRNKAYELVNKGEIKALKVGNQYRIPRDSFISFVKGEVQSV